jgi:hypothetical protein
VNHPMGHLSLGIDGAADRPVRAACAVPYLRFLRVLRSGLRPHPRLRTTPNGVPTHETNPWRSRVLFDGRRPYSRLRTPPTHRPSALAFERPGAAKNCGAVGSVNPVVYCRVRTPEIRRRFSHRGAVGISATSPERNHMVPLRVRVAENGNRRLARGWGSPQNRPIAEDPTPPSREYLVGFQKTCQTQRKGVFGLRARLIAL